MYINIKYKQDEQIFNNMYINLNVYKWLLQEALSAYSHAVELEPSPMHVDALQRIAALDARATRGGDRAYAISAAHLAKEKGNQALRTRETGLAVMHYTVMAPHGTMKL